MIYYFSGTGNSFFAARFLAKALSDDLLSVSQALDQPEIGLNPSLSEDSPLGFVFPVHAWGPPRLMLDLISRLKVTVNPYIFVVYTCGDEAGLSASMISQALAKKGLQLDCAFGLAMPNNYIAGFDVDPQSVAEAKIAKAKIRLNEISEILAKRQRNVFDLLAGRQPRLKSKLINPLFNRFAMSTRPFFATDDCTSCGLCERICPVHTIRVTKKPSWGKVCTQCLACIHRCPVHAIQYGKKTIGKGRYVFPADNL